MIRLELPILETSRHRVMLEPVPNTNPPTLKPDKILETIDRLGTRITERFSQSGLSQVCADLFKLAEVTEATARAITKPILRWRVALTAFLLIVGIALVVTISRLPIQIGRLSLTDLISVIEASTNELVLIAAGVFSLVTIEKRVKRQRVIAAINQLRCIAHIIDMHQLTKDPDSSQHDLDDFRLGRYLDYCSEMLSLVSKIGFLYVNHFDDPEANHAVNELETLTNGLSRKIWQKITIISSRPKRLDGTTGSSAAIAKPRRGYRPRHAILSFGNRCPKRCSRNPGTPLL